VLLGVAKLMGELVRKIGQPAIEGEIAAGILLAPTILGRFLPKAYRALFPVSGHVATVVDAISMLSVVFFLLAAGLETSLRNIFRPGRRALLVSFFGGTIPFVAGLISAELFPGLEPTPARIFFRNGSVGPNM
jgi:Kef-type K+ transport system membrane component KefB